MFIKVGVPGALVGIKKVGVPGALVGIKKVTRNYLVLFCK